MIDKIIDWAKNEQGIHAVILVGSRGAKKFFDPLADYDLAIFCEDFTSYTSNQHWLSKLGRVWVCVNEKVICEGKDYPTRLVIFDGGIKVDFAFFSLDILQKLVSTSTLPPDYDRGYVVLFDKNEITAKMPKPSYKGYGGQIPLESEFLNIIEEFWFEAYHVAMYLKRGDLWSAKFRSSGIQNDFLLKMIVWNELSKNNDSISLAGKKMGSWVAKTTWEALYGVFARFDEQDSRRALLNTMDLFRHLSQETAQNFGFKYPQEIDDQISKFVEIIFG